VPREGEWSARRGTGGRVGLGWVKGDARCGLRCLPWFGPRGCTGKGARERR
jgi:hypothetical protein